MIRAFLLTTFAVVLLVVAVAANPNWGPRPDPNYPNNVFTAVVGK